MISTGYVLTLVSGVAGVARVWGLPGVAGEGNGAELGRPGVGGARAEERPPGPPPGRCLDMSTGKWS